MSLKITKHIQAQLQANEDLADVLFGNVTYKNEEGEEETRQEWRIYPLAIPAGTTYPYVAIIPETIEPAYETKDGGADWDDVSVVVAVVSKTNEQAIDLAEMVRESLECVCVEYEDFTVTSAEIEVIRPFYVQELQAYSFEFHMKFETS